MTTHPDRPNKVEPSEDETLWAAFLQGKREALSELFVRHYASLFRYGIRLIANREDVKDGIQKLFIRLWNKRRVLDEAHSVEFYLLFSLRRILLREKEKCLSRQRQDKKYVQDFFRSNPTVEERMIKNEQESERQALFWSALETLTERQREVLILRLRHGLTNQEIAELLEITHQRVRNYIYEATQQLKSTLYNFSL